MPAGTDIAPPRCHPPPDGGTLRHVNNSLPGPLSEGLVHGNGSRQPLNWLSALAEPFVTVLAHGNGVIDGIGRFRRYWRRWEAAATVARLAGLVGSVAEVLQHRQCSDHRRFVSRSELCAIRALFMDFVWFGFGLDHKLDRWGRRGTVHAMLRFDIRRHRRHMTLLQ